MLFHGRRKRAPIAYACESLEGRLLLAAGTGLRATYYPERFFTGATVVVSPENAANTFGGGDLLYGRGGPGGVPGLGADPANPDPNDTFSGVFEGYLVPQFTDTYYFHTNSDDGIDLKIIDPDTGRLLVDGPPNGIDFVRPMDNGFAETVGSAALTAGKRYGFVGRFSENTANAGYRFGWTSFRDFPKVIPNDVLFPP